MNLTSFFLIVGAIGVIGFVASAIYFHHQETH
jgi:hypothetical protein